MELIERIYEISKKHGLSHIGSCVTAGPLIDDVYVFKKKDEPFILSSGHAGVALYAVLEKKYGYDAEALLKKHGIHPNRDMKHGIWCSSGSLGQGLPIALGMALADRSRNVYVMTSDGEWAEGSMWETLRLAGEQMVSNLTIIINANGYSAYKAVDIDRLEWQIAGFIKENAPKVALFRTKNPVGFEGVDGHYTKL